MRLIELDGKAWRSREDLYDALLPALGALDWHGRNVDALMDSIGRGAINDVEPPFVVKILHSRAMPAELRDHLRDLGRWLGEATREHLEVYGEERVAHIVLDGDA